MIVPPSHYWIEGDNCSIRNEDSNIFGPVSIYYVNSYTSQYAITIIMTGIRRPCIWPGHPYPMASSQMAEGVQKINTRTDFKKKRNSFIIMIFIACFCDVFGNILLKSCVGLTNQRSAYTTRLSKYQSLAISLPKISSQTGLASFQLGVERSGDCHVASELQPTSFFQVEVSL